MTIKYFIGIDPGLNGGLACLDQHGNIIEKDVMPVIKIGTKTKLDICRLVSWIKGCMSEEFVRMIAIEEQRPMHKQGVTSTFSIGKGFGTIEGICAALNAPYDVIRAVDWQKEMFRGQPKANTKVLSAKVAQQLFPTESFIKSPRCTNIHDGLTDAVLIAEYIRRKIK